MIKKIKEFIEAFKDAYNTINVNKNNARKAIDDFKKEVDDITYIADSLKFIFARLEAIYSCFPIKERQDFIIKILDLLRYGRRDANGGLEDICGWYGLYSSQANYMKTKLKLLNDFYKEGKYKEVVLLAKEYTEQLEEFYIMYDINENPNKENE
jgi:hypothetical protein